MKPTETIGVYGSCVSRDSLEYLSTGPAAPEYYIARQSLLSAFGPQTDLDLDLSANKSPFQRRMLESDIAGGAPNVIADKEHRVGLLLWDLVDERGGIYEAPNGGRLTATADILVSDFKEKWEHLCYHTAYGSDRYFRQFEVALAQYYQLLKETGLLERSLFINAPLAKNADRKKLGKPWTRLIVGRQARKIGPTFDQTRIMVQQAGFPTLDVPEELCTFSSDHQWGPASYHYSPGFNRFVARSVERRLGRGAAVICSDDEHTFSLSEPYVLEKAVTDYLRHNVERTCAGASVRVALATQEGSTSQSALLAVKFRGTPQLTGDELQLGENKEYSVALPLSIEGSEFVGEFSWQEPCYLQSVKIVVADRSTSLRITQFAIDIQDE